MSEYIVCPHCHNPLSQSEYVKVVRCRDCVWFCAGNEQYAAVDWCKNFGCEIEPDGFCAWAKRSEK